MSAAVAQARVQQMLHAPLLPTLLRLATPNVMGLFATTIVIGYDGYILGRLGADALAGIAVNPVVGLTTFLAQLFLQNPLSRASAQTFLVDGSWANPQVTRVDQRPAQSPAPINPP